MAWSLAQADVARDHYIRTANEAELTEMALIENIQREDLNAIEIALTFRKLIEQYSLTQVPHSPFLDKFLQVPLLFVPTGLAR